MVVACRLGSSSRSSSSSGVSCSWRATTSSTHLATLSTVQRLLLLLILIAAAAVYLLRPSPARLSATPFSNMPPLTFLTVTPTAKHTATVIFAHGLGDSGQGWSVSRLLRGRMRAHPLRPLRLPVARMLAPALPHVKWILPNAPSQRITLAGVRPLSCGSKLFHSPCIAHVLSSSQGQAMPAWFDILSLEKLSNSPEDEAGMLRSKNDLQALALTHSMDIPSRRCVIGGFSQGCAMALLSGLTGASDEGKTRELSNTVAGVIGRSTAPPAPAQPLSVLLS